MKGIDCTTDQLKSAEQFIMDHAHDVATKPSMVTMPFDSLVRLVAWYGALRFRAGQDGTGGTFEKPGPMVTIRHQEARP